MLRNIETYLLGKRGVPVSGRRVLRKGLVPHGESAEWPLGLAWLAISYAKLAEHGRDQRLDRQPVYLDWPERTRYFEKAVGYFRQLESVMTPDGFVPEMYVGRPPATTRPRLGAELPHHFCADVAEFDS